MMLCLADADFAAVSSLLRGHGLTLSQIAANIAIPGSYWGDAEAGLIGDALYAHDDTPLHSVLHEACHWICMSPQRRDGLHTDARADELEERAVNYLQIVLADAVPSCGRDRMFRDMDAWGYSFRLGSARAWFECDADDARNWLLQRRLIDLAGRLVNRLAPA